MARLSLTATSPVVPSSINVVLNAKATDNAGGSATPYTATSSKSKHSSFSSASAGTLLLLTSLGTYPRSSAGAGSNDELWGDLGDLYWTLGLHQDAQRCWERASLIDPGDGEWSGNLGAIFDGSDPH